MIATPEWVNEHIRDREIKEIENKQCDYLRTYSMEQRVRRSNLNESFMNGSNQEAASASNSLDKKHENILRKPVGVGDDGEDSKTLSDNENILKPDQSLTMIQTMKQIIRERESEIAELKVQIAVNDAEGLMDMKWQEINNVLRDNRGNKEMIKSLSTAQADTLDMTSIEIEKMQQRGKQRERVLQKTCDALNKKLNKLKDIHERSIRFTNRCG